VPRIIIHPGVPKTATTFLQNEVFDKHPDILNIGRPNHGTSEHGVLFHALMHEENAEAAIEVIRTFFDKAGSSPRGRACKAIVYSNESLMDAPLNSLVAARLHAALPEATILLTLRSQFTLVASMYSSDRAILKNVPAPHAGRPVSFDAWFAHAFGSPDMPDAKSGDHFRTYRAYADIFGPDRVHVLLYEQFVRSRAVFMEKLAAVLGVDAPPASAGESAPRVNPSPSQRLRSYQAFRSWFLPGHSLTGLLPGAAAIRQAFDHFLKKGAKATLELNAAQEARLRVLYAEGNRRLAEACGLDLAGEGYPL